MIRNTLAVNSAVLSSARSAPPMLLLAFSPPDEKSHIFPRSLWLFSAHGFFLPSILQRVSRRFGAVCIFFSVTVLAVSHRQNGYLSPGKREARRRVFFLVNFFSTFSGVRHAASVHVSSCFWIYDARDEGTATGSRVLWEEARRNGTVSVECAWFSARALQRRIRCSESASKVVFVFLSLFFGHGRDENFGSCIQ